jgi:hypothetical protein
MPALPKKRFLLVPSRCLADLVRSLNMLSKFVRMCVSKGGEMASSAGVAMFFSVYASSNSDSFRDQPSIIRKVRYILQYFNGPTLIEQRGSGKVFFVVISIHISGGNSQ